jgi:hypothetical protein
MEMRTLMVGLLVLAIMAAGSLARAQEETAKVEVYGGYYFVRFNIHADLAGVAPSATYNANGGGGQVEYNVNRWLGAVGDFAGYGATNSNGDLVGGAIYLSVWASGEFPVEEGESVCAGAIRRDCNDGGIGSVGGSE